MTTSTGARLKILAVLFTLTGCTALLVEQAFEKLLSTLLGASTPAAATVLAVYFGGLTLGGLLFGRWNRRGRIQPLRFYALLELCVGSWALVLYLAFDKLIPIFAPLLALGVDHPWLLQSLRLLVAACWILPATVPMGASFPAVVEALEQMSAGDAGKAMTRFYSFNVLGAILGAVTGPFLVLPFFGVDGALLFGFGVNVTVAGIATALSRNDTIPSRPPTAKPAPVPRLILAGAFWSGFLFFSFEVVWTHLIGGVLGNSVYAFAAMLAVVLLALGLGGAYTSARSVPGQQLPTAELGNLLVIGAAVMALTSGLWPDVPQVLAGLGSRVTSFPAAESFRWFVAGLILLPAALVLGMVYPTLFRLDCFPPQQHGTVAGRIVAVNSIGCISGALLTGFCLIPAVGSESTLRWLTAGCAIWGAMILLTRHAPRSWLAVPVLAWLVFAPGWNRLHLTSGRHVHFHEGEVTDQSQLKFFHEDTRGGITTVVDNPAGVHDHTHAYRTLLTNGKFQGNDDSEVDAQTGFALVPMLYVSRFEEALVIGLGTGRSAHIVETMGFGSVNIAEISPGIVEAARGYFRHINGAVLDQPNVRLFLEDGRNLLLLRNHSYDLITMEISSVWFAGATNLYSEEFYRLAYRRLKPTGIFQQWIQLHHIGLDELVSSIATARRVFPHVSFWVVGGQGILVGSMMPQELQPAALTALGRHPELAAHLPALLRSRLLAPADVTVLAQQPGIVLNTDRNRRLEYFTPRYNFDQSDLRQRNAGALARFATFPPPLIAPAVPEPVAARWRAVTPDDYRRQLKL